jgi:hypothetical protein
VTYDGREICRVDVAKNAGPVWAKTSKAAGIFFARLDNSTRAVPDDDIEAYIAATWATQ